MKKSICILLPLLLVSGLTATVVADQDRALLPHGPMTRLDFVGAKSLPAGHFGGKDGELGDAAVTSDRYDMLRNALDLRLDPADSSLEGSVQMVFASRHNGLVDFVFDLNRSLVVDAVSHASGPLVFSHQADSVIVNLPTALASGVVDSLVVHYHGNDTSPVANRGLLFKAHFPLPEIDRDLLVPIIANMSQPAYAQAWWPCKDRPDDKILVSMTLTVPDTLVGVSNGRLLGAAPADPGWKTYRWREDYPIATYLVSVAVSDYRELTDPCTTTLGTDVPLHHWVFPSDVADAVVDFAPMCDMVDFCESRFGPYPFAGEKYGHAEFLWPGAMEHQTVTSIGSGYLTGLGLHEWLLVHELGHQWFGDSLTPADWADIWLNEGFATYTEALWFEHSVGEAAYHIFMAKARHEGEWVAQGPVYDPVPIFPGRVIYDKGAWILHMLRGRMGDADFFGLVKEWAQGTGRALGYVETQDFIDLATSWAKEDLNDFLWTYLTSTTLPLISMDYEVSGGQAGTDTHLKVVLRQLQTTPLFDNIFPVVVTTTTGQTTHRVRLSSVATAAEFELSAAIVKVELDPEHWVLRQDVSTPVVPEGLSVVFPNPSRGSYVVFRYRLEQSARLQLRVYDVMGREVASLVPDENEPGMNEWGWKVAGDGGERIPSGVYWAALFVDDRRSVAKFSIVR